MTNKIMQEALLLPIEEKAKLIDLLLQSLNNTNDEIDEVWANEAERRLKEIDDGKVELIPGDKVFKNIFDK